MDGQGRCVSFPLSVIVPLGGYRHPPLHRIIPQAWRKKIIEYIGPKEVGK